MVQTVSPKVSQECTTRLQLKVHNVYMLLKLVGHPPHQKYPINLALFIFPSVCNARSLCHQFFSIFFHKVRQRKVKKFQILVFEKKFGWAWRAQKVPKMKILEFKYIYIYIYIYISIYLYIYIYLSLSLSLYIYMIFTTEGFLKCQVSSQLLPSSVATII